MAADKPKNGYELAKAIGVEMDEGVVVAVFPEEVTEVALTGETYRLDEKTQAWGILGKLGPWGDRLLDLATEPEEAVKWWKVTEFAKANGYDLVPVRYSGSIGEIPDRYFEGGVTGVRLYGSGPWFWPLEEPQLKKAVDEEEVQLNNVVDLLNEKHGYNG